jgi:hypothetical protein
MMRSEMRAHLVSFLKKEPAHASSTTAHSESKKYVRMAVARHPAGRRIGHVRHECPAPLLPARSKRPSDSSGHAAWRAAGSKHDKGEIHATPYIPLILQVRSRPWRSTTSDSRPGAGLHPASEPLLYWII